MDLQTFENNLGTIAWLPSYGDNKANFSRLTRFSNDVHCTAGYGIKYVESGNEDYYFNNNKYCVGPKQYLLLNKNQDFHVEVKASKPVHGFCVSLEEKLLQAVYYEIGTPEEKLLDYPEYDKQVQFDFFEDVFSASEILGQFITTHAATHAGYLEDGSSDNYSFYYSLAYHLLISQKFRREQLLRIKASRDCTRKEIFRRTNTAINIIESDLSQKLQIPVLAVECNMSEFHFLRSFKQAFGVSPHQYIMKRRMEKAMSLLRSTSLSITEIAYQLGFNDVACFSKSFKKHFNAAPSSVRA